MSMDKMVETANKNMDAKMQEVLEFLKELQRNNNRPWFESHKSLYRRMQGVFDAFTEQLIGAVASFDPSVGNLSVKDCTYRIYRDVRFSEDKSPYKTHFGAFICRGGKKSGYAGYYFHVEPAGNVYLGGSLLAAGHYRYEPNELRSIREDICYGSGDAFDRAVRKAEGFELETADRLKRVPTGFPADSPYAEYLKYRNYCLLHPVDESFVTTDDLLERTVEMFRTTRDFVLLLNRAIDFAREEM